MICSECGEKVESYADKRKCKGCYNEKMRVYMTQRYHRRRAKYIEMLGDRCVDCGATEQLEIDHIDPLTKSFDVARAISGWSEKRLLPELAKCQILCKNCHRIKSASELTVEHGGGLAGKEPASAMLARMPNLSIIKKFVVKRLASVLLVKAWLTHETRVDIAARVI